MKTTTLTTALLGAALVASGAQPALTAKQAATSAPALTSTASSPAATSWSGDLRGARTAQGRDFAGHCVLCHAL